MRNSIAIFVFTLFLWSSCQENEPIGPQNISSKGIFIANEGNFQWGNATLDHYNPEDSTYTESVFASNNGTALGDVLQSMYLHEGNLYLVVNNSGKIMVVDPENVEQKALISGFTSPRYFLPVTANKAYVTDLYEDAINIVDLNTNTISGSIPLQGWTEELIMANDKVFVTNQERDQLYVIDPSNDLIIDSIAVRIGGNSIEIDQNGKLWVLCSGSETDSINAALYRIDPQSLNIKATFTFADVQSSPWRLSVNGDAGRLYWLDRDVFTMDIQSQSLPQTPFIAANGAIFYALSVDPNNGEVYVSDAIDYVQRGLIIRHDQNGNELHRFLAGIIPGDFLDMRY